VKLRRLDLDNFRQFYGEQGLSFSTDTDRNVTLIYGSNGAGKTTILNAFTWGLYGETTPGLAESEWLVNNLAWSELAAGDTIAAKVRIEFEDKDHVYELVRSQTARKGPDGEREILPSGNASLRVTDSGGQNEQVHNLDGAIGSILPKRLHRFAFFDGERDIERLASADATDRIEDAIKTVLGLEVFERGIVHLKKARTAELNPELSDAGDEQDLELAKRIAGLEEEDERRGRELTELKRNLTAHESELSRVDDELSKIEAAKELQQRRKEIEAAMATAETRIEGADRGIDDRLRRSGFLAFCSGLLERVEDRTAALEEKGEIPAPMKRPFVQGLLEQHECICGTELHEGSPEQEAVMAWFEKAGLPEVEARWGRIGASAMNFRTMRDDLYRFLNETIRERTGFEREQKVLEQKASEIEHDWTEVDDETARQMNEKRQGLRKSIAGTERQIGAVMQKQDDIQQEIAAAEAELEQAKGQSAKAEKARKRVSVAREVEEIFKRVLELRTSQTRSELDERIKKVFGEMCFRPYVPALSERFQLTLSTRIGGDESPVAGSTGESQILALSFVGAMADLARSRYEESLQKADGAGLLSFQGGVFPLVLDAVFGSLDDTYQEGVASSLPDLAPQVIVLVTRGSAEEAIHQQLWPKTGKAAVCTIFTSAEGEERTEVEVPTGAVPYLVPIEDARDRSEIVEI
jgi:DNA sulfur modification protein DndD